METVNNGLPATRVEFPGREGLRTDTTFETLVAPLKEELGHGAVDLAFAEATGVVAAQAGDGPTAAGNYNANVPSFQSSTETGAPEGDWA